MVCRGRGGWGTGTLLAPPAFSIALPILLMLEISSCFPVGKRNIDRHIETVVPRRKITNVGYDMITELE